MRPRYAEEPCRTALTRVSGMPFHWSLNPYTGCVHQCTFCYVRGFELRAGRPSDGRYGTRVRVRSAATTISPVNSSAASSWKACGSR